MKKRLLAVLMALCMAGSLATTAFAVDETQNPETAQTGQVEDVGQTGDGTVTGEGTEEENAIAELSVDEDSTTSSYNYTINEDGTSVTLTLAGDETTVPEKITVDSTEYSVTDVVLPASMTAIPANLFKDNTTVVTVTTSGTITSIGESAFEGCTSLETVPDLSSVTEMGTAAFKNCQSLCFEPYGHLYLSSLNSIPDYAFYNAGNVYDNYPETITKIIFSTELKEIGAHAFENCYMIWHTSYDGSAYENAAFAFPETLETIGEDAFHKTGYYTVSSNVTIYLPDSVTSIGKEAFYDVDAGKVVIGAGISEIPEKAFYDSQEYLTSAEINNNDASVKIASDAFKDNVEITWRQQANDKISDEEDAMTLQEAVNEAAAGEIDSTIVLKKGVKLSKTLNIPAGNPVTIQSAEGENYQILADKDASVSNLITVAEEANVTFQNVTLNGKNNSGSVITTSGSVTIADGTVIKNHKVTAVNTGVIAVSGTSAKLTMTGGSIESNEIADAYSGTVYIANGASAEITGGSIKNNKMTATGGNNQSASSGILVYKDGSCTMSGGEITGNTAYRGSAVMLYNIDEAGSTAKFTLDGGTISGNTCSGDEDASGAVHIEGYANFTMNGGTISDNQGAKGAGVCVVDYNLQKGKKECKTAFTMNGGTISGNVASKSNAGGYLYTSGGGIYSYSNGVQLNAGTITGNTAYQGGGVYSEGNSKVYSTLHMKNAYISGNIAGEHGGGLWFCPTGTGESYVTDGSAIVDNTAGKAGADVVIAGTAGYYLTLADRMLGGGKVTWNKDGGVHADALKTSSVTDKNVARYPENTETVSNIKMSEDSYALKAVPATDSAVAYAKSKATLFIEDNTATRGGGVAANGGVVIGTDTDELVEVSVTKKWEHGTNAEANQPQSVTIDLMVGEAVLEKQTLSADNKWTVTFAGLPKGQTYTVAEETVSGYTTVITGDAESGYTITNTYKEPEKPQATPTATPTATPKPTAAPTATPKPASALPKTGDSFPYAALVVLMCAAVAGFGVVLCRKKKQ